MAPTGFPDNHAAAIVFRSDADWKGRQKIEALQAFAQYAEGLEKTLSLLRSVGKTGEIDLLVRIEASLVNLERAQYGVGDSSVLPSLNAAVQDFDDIKKAIEVVKSPVSYQAAANTYRAKKKLRGIVVDGCHEAINGHITRLGNRISAVGIPVAEKNILRQRQANMRIAKELYMALQCKALGMEPVARGKGRAGE